MIEKIGPFEIDAVHCSDCLDGMRQLPDESVQCIVTSPPYFRLRNYGVKGQIGLETTPEEYTTKLVEVFREARRTLKGDGTLWIILGDSYAGTGKSGGGKQGEQWEKQGAQTVGRRGGKWSPPPAGLKRKDLIGIPWRVAFGLQADGWYLRQDIIWHKPSPMPESVSDRCTKAHEYIFLLSKSRHYYYDQEAIAEPLESDPATWGKHRTKDPGAQAPKPNPMFGPGRNNRTGTEWGNGKTRNKRSVWTVDTKPYKDSHFAVFPDDLIEPCVLAGAPEGEIILDPFTGSGTTGEVAIRNGRRFLGLELNPEYVRDLARYRIAGAKKGISPKEARTGQKGLFDADGEETRK